MKKFDYETLIEIVDQTIQLKDGEGKVIELKVEKVSLPKASDPGYEAFSVDLSSEKEVHCPSGNYVFSHDSFGEAQLFMSPYASNQYQIVIARKK